MRQTYSLIALAALGVVFAVVIYFQFVREDSQPSPDGGEKVVKTTPAKLTPSQGNALAQSLRAAPVGSPLAIAQGRMKAVKGAVLVSTSKEKGGTVSLYKFPGNTYVVILGRNGSVVNTTLATPSAQK